MLRELLYEMLWGATKLLRSICILDEIFNLNRNIFGRALKVLGIALNKILTVCFWIGWYSFLISITGGLYLVWLAIKIAWKASKRERKVKRKFRKRA